ncbi:MAG: DUF2089 family protein [Clostridiales bacterium]
MFIKNIPDWIVDLDNEDLNFIKKFILTSGSLKEIAKHYGVTYPTIRLRLDKIIQKIKINDGETNKPYISLIKKLAIDEKIDIETTKILIDAYNNQNKEEI